MYWIPQRWFSTSISVLKGVTKEESRFTTMRFSLRTLFFLNFLVASWFAFSMLYPHFAFLVGCAVPSTSIALSCNRKHSFLRKIVVAVAFVVSLIPLGIVLHSCCYILMGYEQMLGVRLRSWLVVELDQVYFTLIKATCGNYSSCIADRYLLFLDWSFERGIDLHSFR